MNVTVITCTYIIIGKATDSVELELSELLPEEVDVLARLAGL